MHKRIEEIDKKLEQAEELNSNNKR